MATIDVAIIGAGPYGLSAAAHLLCIKGLDVCVFGEPMSFWERHMPTGMRLRSPLAGSHISDPEHALTLDAYNSSNGNFLQCPIPLHNFVAYGQWFRRQAVPYLDGRKTLRLETEAAGLRLILEDGDTIVARRVVVATGILPFAWRPPEFDGLASCLVSHSSEHRHLEHFAGKKVMVVGGGQSALESAALLCESGATVNVVVRESVLNWTWRKPWLHTCRPVASVLYAPPDIGPAGVSHLVARPHYWIRLPKRLRARLTARSIQAAGAWWLKPRLKEVLVETGRSVASAVPHGGQVRVTLDDHQTRFVDHILLGTGYRVDLSRYTFLGKRLLASIAQHGGYPRLNLGFESSIPGLHFIGATAAWSFSPLMHFIAGTDFTSRTLAREMLKLRAPKTVSLGVAKKDVPDSSSSCVCN